MTNKRLWFVLGLLSLGGISVSQAQQSSGATAKAVAALENQWLQSQKTNNPDLVAPLLADKMVSTGNDGKVENKAQMLADAKSRKYDSAEYENVQVMVYGNTAIATGTLRGKGTDATGKRFDDHDRWTDTWIKMPSGSWQCVATPDFSIKT
jgi:ketosteroid isomerase-like protein